MSVTTCQSLHVLFLTSTLYSPPHRYPLRVEEDAFTPILTSKGPYHVHFTHSTTSGEAEVVVGRPTNVRQAIIETVVRVCDAMLKADSDNTRAYNTIVNVSVVVHLIPSPIFYTLCCPPCSTLLAPPPIFYSPYIDKQ